MGLKETRALTAATNTGAPRRPSARTRKKLAATFVVSSRLFARYTWGGVGCERQTEPNDFRVVLPARWKREYNPVH